MGGGGGEGGGGGSVNLNLKTIHILTKDSELPHGWLER